jgi:predicted dehydrogenase
VSALRIAVIGAGVMGGHHARKVRDRAQRDGDVVLSGIYDADAERARAVAGELGAPAVADAAQLFAGADAAIVAVSAVAHYEVARRALEAGSMCWSRSRSPPRCPRRRRWSRSRWQRERVLQVGHQEWFNAALRVVHEQIDRPRFAEIHRLGPFPERGTDVDVVRDLMIHDIEILQQLFARSPTRSTRSASRWSPTTSTSPTRGSPSRARVSRISPRAACRRRRCASSGCSSATPTSRSISWPEGDAVPARAHARWRQEDRGAVARDRPRGRARGAARRVRRGRAPAQRRGLPASRARRRPPRCAPRCA